jgi:uncharacterized membrane protein
LDHDADYGPEHRLERLAFFSDAVFAIAITLLVIEIHVPDLPRGASDGDWLHGLYLLIPSFWAFALSFVVIGTMWILHHKTLSMMARFAGRLMWPNLLFLMSVAFLPFSTAFMAAGSRGAAGHAGPSPVPFVFYDASLLVAGLLKARLTRIALRPDLLSPHVRPSQVAAERRQVLILPLATTLALVLAFVIPAWNNLAMLTIPLFRLLPYFKEHEAPGSEPAEQVA